MKKFFGGLAVFLLLAVSIPSNVLAQQNGSTDKVTQVDSEEPINDPESKPSEDDSQARIDAIKNRVSEKLTAAEEKRVTGRCKAAQVIVQKLGTNLDKILENRRSKYADISDKLGNLLTRLESTSADTAILEATIVELDRRATSLVDLITKYDTTLTDLSSMDCEADAAGFKAVLSEARTIRASVIDQSQALKKYVTEDIRAVLSELKEQLKVTDTVEGE